MWNGKKFLFLLLAVFLFVILLISRFYGVAVIWRVWGVPAMPSIFADLHSITAGIESQRAGYDPLYMNPNDPYGRPMTYPRLWLTLGFLGIQQKDTLFLEFVILG